MSTQMAVNKNLVIWGSVLVIAGLLAPLLMRASDLGILTLLDKSIATNSVDDLLFASFKLVVLNTIRAIPHYTGVLLIAEGVGWPRIFRFRMLIPLLLIPAIYEIIPVFYGITYHLGVPAITLIIAIIIVNKMRDMARHIVHKTIILILLLFGVEWLDIVPKLSPFGFGRGEISMDIKRVAAFINAEGTLEFVGIALFLIFVANAFITARLLSVYTREIKEVEHAWHLEHLANELQLRALESRSLREMQSLVHDLKTPLTTIQGLAGVILISDVEGHHREHVNKISDAVDKMNKMISELLLDETRQIITAKQLVEYAVAHVPQLNSIAKFEMEIMNDKISVSVNKTKMSRAIINILQNSLDAIEPQNGYIAIQVTLHDRYVTIKIIDNGKGIAAEHNFRVWDAGFSTKNSSGLGLTFVQDVIEKNGGTIKIDSELNFGTTVTIVLPEVYV